MSARSLSVALTCAIGSMLAVPLAHADIYTWTDPRGVINVSNLPPPEGAKISHLVHEQPPPAAAAGDSAREAARRAELQALSERVQQLEAEASGARSTVPPDLVYAARAPVPPPAVTIQCDGSPAAPAAAIRRARAGATGLRV